MTADAMFTGIRNHKSICRLMHIRIAILKRIFMNILGPSLFAGVAGFGVRVGGATPGGANCRSTFKYQGRG